MAFLSSKLPTTAAESPAGVQSKIDLFESEDGMSLWAIVVRSANDVIGDVGLQWEEYEGERVADIGCRLIRRYWSLGYANEASRAVLVAGFRDLGVERIFASTHVENERARPVLEQLDAKDEHDVRRYGAEMALYSFTPR